MLKFRSIKFILIFLKLLPFFIPAFYYLIFLLTFIIKAYKKSSRVSLVKKCLRYYNLKFLVEIISVY